MNTPLPDPAQPERLLRRMAARCKAATRRSVERALLSRRIANALKPAAMQIFARSHDPLCVSTSYVIVRNGIGVLGLAFPIVLMVGGGLDQIQGSLSAYYHFSRSHPASYGAGTMRDAFVGMLSVIGAFLFFYRGHSFQEDFALNVAGISVVLVALCPMDWPNGIAGQATTTAKVHSVAATAFFIMIAYVCIFRARDTLCIMYDLGRRKNFERIYFALGISMAVTPLSIAAIEFTLPAVQRGYATLLVEVAGVFVFSAFWIIKGFEIRASVHLTLRANSHGENRDAIRSG